MPALNYLALTLAALATFGLLIAVAISTFGWAVGIALGLLIAFGLRLGASQ